MKKNFKASLAEVLKWEGGYVNHPQDPGGHTNQGITLKTLKQYMPGATVTSLKNISPKMVGKIYREGYWNKVKGDQLASGVDLVTFDYAVNSGPGTAWRELLKVVGGTDSETVKKLCMSRLARYRTFRHWPTFGRGWTRRINGVMAKGLAMSGGLQEAVRTTKSDMHKTGAAGTGAVGGGVGSATIDFNWVGFTIAGVCLVVAVIALLKREELKERLAAFKEELS